MTPAAAGEDIGARVISETLRGKIDNETHLGGTAGDSTEFRR